MLTNKQAIYIIAGTVYLTNTLVASHTVGIENAGAVVAEWNSLFSGVTTRYLGAVASTNSITGTAAFLNAAADDYHLTAASAAIGAGTLSNPVVGFDIDGQARPAGAGFDIGFDEWAPYIITPLAGPGGAISPGAPLTVDPGSDATFTITPDTNYHIVDVGVDGVSQGVITSYTFTNITADHTISATFATGTYTLTVTRTGSGNGVVTSTPTGLNCGGTCAASFNAGIIVTLDAVANSGSVFTGWSGAGCSGTGQCVATMDAARSVTATFTATVTDYRLYLPIIRR